ncbi:MAG: Tryptophan synthase beta chain 2 [Candidatus Thorarchaeota archaeon]|nr:MAG: Tryptophan synthase beta chain 2 [Candidatus Thorarchaeota archaeon]
MSVNKNRITLDIEDVPKNYVNIVPYLSEPLAPPIDPGTGEPASPDVLTAIFAQECVRQEATQDKLVKIPTEIREALMRFGRPSPLQRAVRLEEQLRTPARIYFKREDVSPTGSHKLNTALAQAYYAAKEGTERLATETGAGQWGSAVALACSVFDIEAMVYMVKISYEQKRYRGTLMRSFGATIVPSPSDITEFGRKILKANPDHPGTLGIAISEALEDTLSREDTKYTLGSVLNHVLLHQTVIGQEVIAQLESVDEKVDTLIGCVGGGSNFGGMVFPFLADSRFDDVDYIAVEPTACPTLTKGEYKYDFGDTAGLTPKLKMYSLGQNFTPPKIHAGGLRYHGMAPTISALVHEGRIKPIAYDQVEVLHAGVLFAKCEGIIPAPESAHAIKAAIDRALYAKRNNREETIVLNLSGHGYFDMGAYDSLLSGSLSSEEGSLPKGEISIAREQTA